MASTHGVDAAGTVATRPGHDFIPVLAYSVLGRRLLPRPDPSDSDGAPSTLISRPLALIRSFGPPSWLTGKGNMLEGLPPNNAAHRLTLVSDEKRARAVADLIVESFEPAEAASTAFETEDPWPGGGKAWLVEAYFGFAPDEDARPRAHRGRRRRGDRARGDLRRHREARLGRQCAGRPSRRCAPGAFSSTARHDRARVRANDVGIEIEAGLAFGTGHHGTTRGCLLHFDRLLKRRRPASRARRRLRRRGAGDRRGEGPAPKGVARRHRSRRGRCRQRQCAAQRRRRALQGGRLARRREPRLYATARPTTSSSPTFWPGRSRLLAPSLAAVTGRRRRRDRLGPAHRRRAGCARVLAGAGFFPRRADRPRGLGEPQAAALKPQRDATRSKAGVLPNALDRLAAIHRDGRTGLSFTGLQSRLECRLSHDCRRIRGTVLLVAQIGDRREWRDGENTGRGRPEAAADRRPVRRDRRSLAAQAAARPLSSRRGRASFRIAGSSASRSTTSTSTAFARSPVRRSNDITIAARAMDAWPAFEALARLRAALGRRRRTEGGGRKSGCGLQRAKPARPLSERAAERSAVGGPHARRRRPRQGLAHHHGEAVRHRSRKRDFAQRQAARRLLRGPDLPHRPFPRQGAGAEHSGLPLRQRPVRADLEPQFHRPRPDRRAGDARSRQPHRLLRADRRLSRHGRHPPLPDPRLHGDGAADLARRRDRSARKRTRCSAR